MAESIAKGIDVSSHQGDVDFEKVKAAGDSFVIIKAGPGVRGMGTVRGKDPAAGGSAGGDWGG